MRYMHEIAFEKFDTLLAQDLFLAACNTPAVGSKRLAWIDEVLTAFHKDLANPKGVAIDDLHAEAVLCSL